MSLQTTFFKILNTNNLKYLIIIEKGFLYSYVMMNIFILNKNKMFEIRFKNIFFLDLKDLKKLMLSKMV